MADCIDLAERFGEKFKIGKDPAYAAEYGPNAWTHDPWLLVILCERGTIYPHGGDWLAFSTNGRGPTAKRLAALPCVEVLQDGDDGINGKFHVDHFSEVARLMRPRRRRQVSDAERARLAELSAQHGFKRRSAISQLDSEGQTSVPAGSLV